MAATDFASIHYDYEQRVIDRVLALARRHAATDADLLPDIACVALNRLPPRDIRHNVDFSFCLTDLELEKNTRRVNAAVDRAYTYVLSRSRRRAACGGEAGVVRPRPQRTLRPVMASPCGRRVSPLRRPCRALVVRAPDRRLRRHGAFRSRPARPRSRGADGGTARNRGDDGRFARCEQAADSVSCAGP
jgi:hypothetical protein